MHSALFVVQIPTHAGHWEQFVANVERKLKNTTSALRLAENVWLVNMRQSPAPLGYLIGFAEAQGLPYGILPFERAPEWLPGEFDPKTILGQSGGS